MSAAVGVPVTPSQSSHCHLRAGDPGLPPWPEAQGLAELSPAPASRMYSPDESRLPDSESLGASQTCAVRAGGREAAGAVPRSPPAGSSPACAWQIQQASVRMLLRLSYGSSSSCP